MTIGFNCINTHGPSTIVEFLQATHTLPSAMTQRFALVKMALLRLFLLLCPVVVQAIQVADPAGRYGIGFRQQIIPKHTPDEPLPAPNGEGTFILMSIYYPTESHSAKPWPYADPTSARIFEKLLKFPNGSLDSLETRLQPDAPFVKEEAANTPALPTIIFSPGLGNNAFMYYGLISNLVSNGYTVLALDHPYEPPALLLPNGTTVLGLSFTSTPKLVAEIARYRISDIKAAAAVIPDYAANVSAPFNTSNFFCIGHSLGGASSAPAAAEIPGALGGINFDGLFVEPFLPDVGKPFLTMLSINHTFQFDESLPKFSSRQTSWWEMPVVYSAYHNDYSDIGLWPQLLGIGWNTIEPVSEGFQIGPIGGSRMSQIVRAYVMQFLDFVLHGSEGILAHPSPEWWEVIYLNGSAFNRAPASES